MNACAETCEPWCACMLHGYIVQSGWNAAVEVNNSVLSFYTKFGEENEVKKAVGVFNHVSQNAIIDAYMRIGNVEEERLTFQRMHEKNIILWTSMITGYMRNRHGEFSLRLFVDMIRSGIQPDNAAFDAVLHACSSLATLGYGRMVHGSVVHSSFWENAYVGNDMVNMYAKCGDISSSHKAFNDIIKKDLISWYTMLFEFGLHGSSNRAVSILEEVIVSGEKPDKVTFIGLLMMCNHLGTIDEGLLFYESMSSHYGLSPDIDHVDCVVGMLRRGGKLEKAKEFVNRYIGADNSKISSFEALFGSCFGQGDLTAGAEFGERLQNWKPRDEMSYVLLSKLVLC